MYSLARSLLFRFDPETAHGITMTALDMAYRCRLSHALGGEAVQAPVTLMGLHFPNRVGLAAGLDKDGEHIDALGALGFGFVEVGTVTPKAQPGNPRPRLFRLPEHQAIINRMGFNNGGVEQLVEHVRRRHFDGVLGINIGKNLTTDVADATSDYLSCLEVVHAHADYVTVNISSPNTPGLRDLQFGDHLQRLLSALSETAMRLDVQNGRHVPLAVKIAPDMADEELELVAHCLAGSGVEAVIATNTTISRTAVAGSPLAKETGGLSGAPVKAASTRVIAALRDRLPTMTIIGVGGILDAEDAREKREAGADLVQLYTGLIYRGPALVGECARALG
ncbi:quinone-dependent dihydroorotate dehydrogenase [Kushneria phosphatilytica]|uniref:Dihydroorotate dehydrogenase (quinone) n=1 Tax=Kushneria phosphatilytica TaxID=657387 RepID=A0A1S1NTD8_9GAMM|nr:quinone-dependent dihydroorotate dehydrogenase [Kushneria phosphatilytica]OHV10040.1 dihydroorotate dehydrogenase (quinone) [Kushneria phosphatilytica]QEL11589.1 quinone-dependent dihydroorotate dehydrogenase [Kushneria phosphatilytica]